MSIALTENAATKIHGLLRQKALPDGACLRVGLKGGCCGNVGYTLDVTDGPAKDDETFVSHEVRIVCDPKAYRQLKGTTIDYDDAPDAGGFVFHNPNAKDECGCGEGFST